MLIVKKYGGSSVSTPEKILAIAQQIKKLKADGLDLIVVVSAMGDTTDHLIELTQKVTKAPIQREMDMLLSSGERISMSLVAIALNSIGVEAISFTGSQSGVFTNSSHSNARIDDIRAFRVKDEIDKGKVVIIAGFQGVNPQTKEVTTLGRGGSDTTAVAMAAAFGAAQCEILTDVEGVFSGNPRIENLKAKHFSQLDYDVALEMTYWGAGVLHYRSVELAERNQLPLWVNLSSENGRGTLVGHKAKTEPEVKSKGKIDKRVEGSFKMEKTEVMAVNSNTQVAQLKIKNCSDVASALEILGESIKASNLATPQIIYERNGENKEHGSIEFFLSLPEENFDGLAHSIGTRGELDPQWSTVTLTGRGLVNSPLAFEASRKLKSQKIVPEALIVTPLSLTFLIPKAKNKEACLVLHQEYCDG